MDNQGVMTQMSRQKKTQDRKVLGSTPAKARTFFLFVDGCFKAHEIDLWVFEELLQIHVIINSYKKCRRRYPLSVSCVQVPVTIQEKDDWGTYNLQLHPSPRLHEGTSKTWRSIESLTLCVFMCYTVCWSKYRPNMSSFKKIKTDGLSFLLHFIS